MAATANRFAAGHRLRVDICSADFPKLERNANTRRRAWPAGPRPADVFHGAAYPSHLLVYVTDGSDQDLQPGAGAGRSKAVAISVSG